MNRYVVELLYWHKDHPETTGVARLDVKADYHPSEEKVEELRQKYLLKYLHTTHHNADDVKSSTNVIVKEG